MAWEENLTQLNYLAAGLYPFKEDTLRLVKAAGIPPQYVRFSDRAVDNWSAILTEADNRRKVDELIAVLLEDHPDHPLLERARRGKLNSARGPVIGDDLDWHAEGEGEGLERLMERQSTLLPISFLSRGVKCAKAVARVRMPVGTGSGFLTDGNLLVTNHHVIPGKEEARVAKLQFNYEQTWDGLWLDAVEFVLDPDAGFRTSAEDDWTLVRVRGDANAEFGRIPFGEVEIAKEDRVNIVQHPGGNAKQIALYHNVVAYADERRVQYLTDTLPGSSGSPVFDSRWTLVAVHHSGGHIREPGSKRLVYRNEGIHAGLVREAIGEVVG